MEQNGITLWLTGLSGAGKTTIAQQLEHKLQERDRSVERLDADVKFTLHHYETLLDRQ